MDGYRQDGQHTHRISLLGCLSEFPETAFFAKSNSGFLRECGIALHKAPKASLMVILQQINMAGNIIRIYYQVKLATNQHSSIRVRTGWQFVLSARIDTIFATAINFAELPALLYCHMLVVICRHTYRSTLTYLDRYHYVWMVVVLVFRQLQLLCYVIFQYIFWK